MKQEYKHIDELLKETLQGYSREPSAGVWRKIAASLFFQGGGFYLLLLFLVLVGGGFLLTGPLNRQDTSQNQEVPVAQAPSLIPDKELTPVPAPEALPGSELQATKGKPSPNQPNQEELAKNRMAAPMVTMPTDSNDPKVSMDAPHASSSTTTLLGLPGVASSNPYPDLERLGEQQRFPLHILAVPHFTNLQVFPGQAAARNTFSWPAVPDDYGFRKSNSLLLQLTPEVIFSGENRKTVSYSLNSDLLYVVEGRDGFLQAGAGLGIAEDDGVFNINYSQYDSLGFYEQVQSFSIDQATGQPVFQTTTEGVFDTVDYSQSATSSNLYYYFRIPVRAGLTFYEHKRLRVYVQAGATYSLLVRAHEPGIGFTNDRALSVEITDRTPARIKDNLQLSLGVGLRYRLSHRFDLRFDGLYNYYWNELVERQNAQKSPFSLGLGIGLQFKL